MKFLASAALVSSAFALALPADAAVDSVQETQTFGGGYYYGCTCTANGYRDDETGYFACQDLNYRYPNLDWDGHLCYDRNRVGVEAEGFGDACARNGKFGIYYTSLCYN